jgi:hypothetical protein
MIDVGCAEDCGFLPMHIYGADTRLPLNINDGDISLRDIIAPAEREGFTDMTYPLTRVSKMLESPEAPLTTT